MPTYAYACTACEHSFEVQQSFTDAALTQCPECASRVRKVFTNVGIVFKGSGFYRNDSRSTQGRDGNGSSNGKDGADSGTSDAAGTPKEPASGEGSPAKRPESPAAARPGAGTSNGTSSSGSRGATKPAAAPGNRKAPAGSSPAG